MDDLLTAVYVAPMAGGPSGPALVTAAGRAGAIGFLAAGYQTPATVEDGLRTVQKTGLPYGLNIFVPMPPPVDVAPLDRYRELLRLEADRYDVDLPPLRLADDDHFAAKVELAVAYRVPLVSFTFGVPGRGVVSALHAAGSRVLITVTSHVEARRAAADRPDALIAQGGSAGAHSATMDPGGYRGTTSTADVIARVRGELPVLAAGGVASPADVHGLLTAGAAGVLCGTAFLLADEAGTRPAHRAALLSGSYRETVVTRAFTGHPARGLRNRFTDTYSAHAPIGFPAVHHLTAPIRAAAATRNDPEALNLWAGTGHAAARPAPLAHLLDSLRP